MEGTEEVRRRIGRVVGILGGDLVGDSGGLSDYGSEVSAGVLVVTDVFDSHSSTVVVMSEVLVSDSDWEVVTPQTFSFSRKRQAVCVENQQT